MVSFRWVLVLCLTLVLAGAGSAAAAAQARNVIVLIVDGCSAEQYTFARWFKGAPLSFDPYRVGAIKTYIADSVIADSAPAASAFATGIRTSDKHISVGPHPKTITGVPVPADDLQYRPLATVLEGARLLKKGTGIVATSRVSHATPGAYVAHVAMRDDEDDIMEQAVHQGIDVVLGGGKRHLLPKENKGVRADGENLYQVLKGWGYAVVENRQDLLAVSAGRVYGMFADNHMDPEIDRPALHPDQPTLAEMTRKAIELLSRHREGFFLMVEGSQVDWACHANDPPHMLSDLLAYDQAVQAALEFAKKDGHTLVLAISDHNTGGFSIGNHNSNKIYPQMKVEEFLDPFRRMKTSGFRVWESLPEKTPDGAQGGRPGRVGDGHHGRGGAAGGRVGRDLQGQRLPRHRRGALPHPHVRRLDHPRPLRGRRPTARLRPGQARWGRGRPGHRPDLRIGHGHRLAEAEPPVVH